MFSMTGAGLSLHGRDIALWFQLLARLEAKVVEVRDGEVNVDVIQKPLPALISWNSLKS